MHLVPTVAWGSGESHFPHVETEAWCARDLLKVPLCIQSRAKIQAQALLCQQSMVNRTHCCWGLAALSFPQFLPHHMTVGNHPVIPSCWVGTGLWDARTKFAHLWNVMWIVFLSYGAKRLSERLCGHRAGVRTIME